MLDASNNLIIVGLILLFISILSSVLLSTGKFFRSKKDKINLIAWKENPIFDIKSRLNERAMGEFCHPNQSNKGSFQC